MYGFDDVPAGDIAVLRAAVYSAVSEVKQPQLKSPWWIEGEVWTNLRRNRDVQTRFPAMFSGRLRRVGWRHSSFKNLLSILIEEAMERFGLEPAPGATISTILGEMARLTSELKAVNEAIPRIADGFKKTSELLRE